MEPQFIQGPRGRLFVMYRRPETGPVQGVVLFIPPFGEEMNKSRRMLALTARALNAKGYVTVLPDLFGTGDSEGDFGDADWDTWLNDLGATVDWIRERHAEPLSMLALRFGALLASQLMTTRMLCPQTLVLWNPVIQGQQALTQFLRLRVAGSMTDEKAESTKALRERLVAGEPLEIAGYMLSPGLAQGLENAVLQPDPEALPESVVWLEVSSRDEPVLSPASHRAVAAWEQAGALRQARAVPGDAFWNTVELVDAPDLVTATEAVF